MTPPWVPDLPVFPSAFLGAAVSCLKIVLLRSVHAFTSLKWDLLLRIFHCKDKHLLLHRSSWLWLRMCYTILWFWNKNLYILNLFTFKEPMAEDSHQRHHHRNRLAPEIVISYVKGLFGLPQAVRLTTRKKWTIWVWVWINRWQIVKGYLRPIRTHKTSLWENLQKSDSNVIKEEREGAALAVYLGQASCCSWRGCTLTLSFQRTAVICFAVEEEDQAGIWFEASVTWTNDSFLDCWMCWTQVFLLVELGGIACSGWSWRKTSLLLPIVPLNISNGGSLEV